MFAIVSADLRLAHANAAFRQFIGWQGQEPPSLVDHLEHGEDVRARAGDTRDELAIGVRGAGGRVLEATLVPFTCEGARMFILEARARASGEWREAGVLAGDLLDRIAGGVCAIDATWRFVYVNRAAAALLRRTRDEMLGEIVWDVFPEARGTMLEQQYRHVHATGEPATFEMVSPASGRQVRIHAYASGESLVIYVEDITEERRIRAELEAAEARIHAVFEHANVGMLLANGTTGRVLAANPEACRILGRSEDELRCLGREDLVDTTDPRAPPLDHTTSLRGQVYAVRGDGTRVEVDYTAAPFVTADGAACIAVVFTDYTAQRRSKRLLEMLARAGELTATLELGRTLSALVNLVVPALADRAFVEVRACEGRREVAGTAPDPREPLATLPLSGPSGPLGVLRVGRRDRFEPEDLIVLRAVAERAALAVERDLEHDVAVLGRRLRDEVLAIVAHDLRAPLNSALLATGLLEKRLGKSDETGAIGRSLARASRLIQDLLLVARMESDTALPVERSDVRLEEVMADVVETFASGAEKVGVELRASVEPPELHARVDRVRVVQLLSNLVDNAIRHTRRGGHIVIEADADTELVHLRVRDDGEGMSREQLGHVFDRFWQGASTRRAGAGLGLAIAKGIAEAHGGGITVESQEGKGTTFSVDLRT